MGHTLAQSDVFIAGGGPAGLAAAIAARQAGFSVTVVDPAAPPIDKACGEGILPSGLDALAALGIRLPDSASTAPFHGIRFLDGARVAEASFRHGRGLGVRRTVLHEILVQHALEAGVSLHWGLRVTGLVPGGVVVNGKNFPCRWVIGADGHNSAVRRWIGIPPRGRERQRVGFRMHYPVAPWTEFVEVYWGHDCQIYVTPVDSEAVCVASISTKPHLRLAQALAHFPQLQRRLAGVAPLTREQGGVSVSRRLASVFRGDRILLGEASGSLDAITGEGLSLVFQQAVALRSALRASDLSAYASAHRQIARLPGAMAHLLLAMSDHEWFRHRVFGAFARDPSTFPALLAVHSGESTLAEFGLPRAFATIRNIAFAPSPRGSQEIAPS